MHDAAEPQLLRLRTCGSLGPLSACKLLQTFDYRYTRVSVLSPLEACTALVALWCDPTFLTQQARGLLTACRSLKINGRSHDHCITLDPAA